LQREDITFQSAGTRCAAWLYPAAGSDRARTPCVILAHGFSAVRDQRLDAFAERFAQAGLAALVFDYRHFGDSDGQPRQLLDIRGQLEDWRAAIAHARTLEHVDSARVAIWGTSFSGGHVIRIAAEDATLAAAVAQVPFVDGIATLRAASAAQALWLTREGLRDQLAAMRGRPPHTVAAVGPPKSRSVMNTPDAEPGMRAVTPPDTKWRNEVAARIGLRVGSYRPGRRAAQIRCPILFCVADNDQLTPPAPARKAAARAPRAELKRYPIGHFDIYVGEWFERAATDQGNFLSHHLLGQDRADAGAGVPAGAV